jgi:hypothetical protein
MHPFEKAELGKAPFRFVGSVTRIGPIYLADGITQIGAPGQPMGTCKYCGQGIALCMRIKSADGNVFEVGIDCVEKLYRPDNATITDADRAMHNDPVYRAVKAAKNEHNRKVRHAREAIALEEARKWADDNRAAIKAIPNPHRAGESMWDTLQWHWVNAGTTGKLGIVKQIKQLHASQSAQKADA